MTEYRVDQDDQDDLGDQMDELLRRAHQRPVPRLSPKFDRRLEKRLRQPRLSAGGRRLLAVYGALAVALTLWALSDLPLAVTAGALALSTAVPFVVARRRRSW